ncbi:MAG: succinate dehydrogenase [Ignavibacteriae bacterium HGW-Ignavibacteriae-3]|nr:MAG: succinate dehydrogenase [Ignavibacteriae bacterium HGW-Ignavibacteriae-3]
MGWVWKSLNSSIGKKLVMAITGVALMLFLIVHLAGNMTLFGGKDAFNNYVGLLEHIKPFIRVIEVILGLVFVFHIFNGTRLWIENKQARPQGYSVNGSRKNTTVFSRTAFITGSIVFIFLVVHLQTIWYVFNFSGSELDLYTLTTDLLGIWWYAALYFIAVLLLGFHLNHGFQSAFQTFGWNHKKYFPFIEKLGTFYAIIMTIGFGSIPVYFFFLGGK